MGAKKQGRRTRKRAAETIDSLTLLVGSVEYSPIQSLRALAEPLAQLEACLSLLEPVSTDSTETGNTEIGSETLAMQSVRNNLFPLIEMVIEPEVIAPPFSPDLRQRLGYSAAILSGMRSRLAESRDPLRTKVVLRAGAAQFGNFTASWNQFRNDPTLPHLSMLHKQCRDLSQYYWAVGIPRSEPRMKAHRRLCERVQSALDRDSDLAEVPSLMRQITTGASQLARPTVSEHSEWLRSQLA